MPKKTTPTMRWKRQLGTDRKYTERVNRAIARGEYTELGTPSNPSKSKKKVKT